MENKINKDKTSETVTVASLTQSSGVSNAEPTGSFSPPEDATAFTVDSDGTRITEVPSINKLLNRKTLETPPSPSGVPRTLPPPAPSEKIQPPPFPTQLPSSVPTLPAIANPAILEPQTLTKDNLSTEQKRAPKIKPFHPRLRSVQLSTEVPPFLVWSMSQIQSSSQPLQKGIAQLLAQGAQHVLFLAIRSAILGETYPHFQGQSGIGATQKVNLWRGLEWNPSTAPSLWEPWVKHAFVEIVPKIGLNRKEDHLTRATFGAAASEYLLLLRVGTVEGCRGMLAVFSTQSLTGSLSPILPFLANPHEK